jgi:SAM-dependent methyltransferase
VEPAALKRMETGGDAREEPRPGAVCPACRDVNSGAALEASHGSKLFACGGCDLHFWHPVMMPDAAWHERAYQGRDQTAMPLEPGHIFFLRDEKRPRNGRLLDLGCGVGNFLAAARDVGFDVTGLELNGNAVRFAREHYGLEKVHATRPEEFRGNSDGGKGKFEVVTFFEVLEHQENPRGFLEAAKGFLKEDGYIALSVPNRNRWQKGTETLDYPPNHLTRWSPRALGNFLRRNGFEVLSMREEPLGMRRAAQVMSAGMRTRLMSRVATEPTPADLAEMKPAEMEEAMRKVTSGRRHRLAARLAALKVRALLPVAGAALPLLRMRGYRGLYLYCLAKRKRDAGEAGVERERPGVREAVD